MSFQSSFNPHGEQATRRRAAMTGAHRPVACTRKNARPRPLPSRRRCSTSAASCCRASVSACCSIRARRICPCVHWPAFCTTPRTRASRCPVAACWRVSASSRACAAWWWRADSGIEAGAIQPRGLEKILRVQEIALENKLPFVHLVESAGANLMKYQVEGFVLGGGLFRNLARACRLPACRSSRCSTARARRAAPTCRACLSDVVIMVRGRSRAFLAGPPLLKAATGEVATEEELGGAEMHTAVSGLGEYLAEDDREALGIARQVVSQTGWQTTASADASRPATLRRRRPAVAHAAAPPRYRSTCVRSCCASPTVPTCSNSSRSTAPRRSACRRTSAAIRSASSATTAPSTWPARTRPRTSSSGCASSVILSSTCRTPPATWSARTASRPA